MSKSLKTINKSHALAKDFSVTAVMLMITLMVLNAIPPQNMTIKNTSTPIASATSPAPVDLGTAANFVILTKTGITTTGVTAIGGNVGVSPITAAAMTGFGLIMDASNQFSTSTLVTGKIYAASYAAPTPAMLITAISDMETAYTNAAGRTSPDYTELGAGNIGGMTLVPGLYKWSSVLSIPTDVILSGNSTDVWIFQIAQTLIVSSNVQVLLSGGAQSKNIFWQVAGQATLGSYSIFNGNILCATAIVLNSGARLNGRALAQTASTLIANTITAPTVVANPTTTTTPIPTPTIVTVDLKTAANFVVLTKTGITTTGITAIAGDIGVSPTAATSMTGFGLIMDASNEFSTSTLVTGKIYASDYAAPTPAKLITAISDMEAAYTDAAGRTTPDYTELGAGSIGGMTLAPGLYKWSTGVTVPTDITLSGISTDVWIFQIAQTLTIAAAAHVILSGGAQVKNIFWQVAGQTTLGSASVFSGNILCATAIVFDSGATLEGRALAQTAVTLIANTIIMPQSKGGVDSTDDTSTTINGTPFVWIMGICVVSVVFLMTKKKYTMKNV